MHHYCYKKSERFGCPGVPNNKYTFSTRGYPCFWDHDRTDCAWCSPGGYQCGPGQKAGSERFGCPGVPNNKYTFSTRGYPCFWDHDRTNCAWCSPGGYQCGPGQKAGPEAKDR